MLPFLTVCGCRIFNTDCDRCIPAIVQPGLRHLEKQTDAKPHDLWKYSDSVQCFKFKNSQRLAGTSHFLFLLPLQGAISKRCKMLGNVIERKYVPNVRGKHQGLVSRENHCSYSQTTGSIGTRHKVSQSGHQGADEKKRVDSVSWAES